VIKKLFLILLSQVLLFGAPNWFLDLDYDRECEVIGYGMKADLGNAKEEAIMELTNSILLSAKTSSKIPLEIVDTTGDDFLLGGVEYVKTEQMDGIWYVAAKYDYSPFEIKVKKLLPHDLSNEKQNRYLKNTWAIKNLNVEIGKKLDFKLVRKYGNWQIFYKDIYVPVAQNDLYKFFSNQKNEDISIVPNQNIYKVDDEMFFKIRHKGARYISILYVGHRGKVRVLLENYSSNSVFNYPYINSKEVFKVVNPYNKTIKELYVAISSKEPIDIQEFQNISNDQFDEDSYNFGKLIDRLDGLKFSTTVIKIRK
jgi:hypothetical protein